LTLEEHTHLKLLLQPAHARLQLAQRAVLRGNSCAQRSDFSSGRCNVRLQHGDSGQTRLFFCFFIRKAALDFAQLCRWSSHFLKTKVKSSHQNDMDTL
jgi:hypothetical protein